MVSSGRPLGSQTKVQREFVGTKHPPTPVCLPVALYITIADPSSDSNASDDKLQFSGDLDEDYHITSTVATPLTPISPKPSPRYPSDILKIHRCTYADCNKSFNRPAKLAQHLRSHTNTRPFLCPHALCTKDFLRESHLKHHVKSAHSDVREHVCDWEGCGKSFVNATRLKRHHAAHEGREQFRCTIAGCVQTFRKHGTLQKHILAVHEGRKPFNCQISDSNGAECGAGFDTEGQLKSHAGRVHEHKSFLCTICPPEGQLTTVEQILEHQQPSFSTYTALREHIENEHPPACTEGGQECKCFRDLKSHLEVVHGDFDVIDSRAHFCLEKGCRRRFTKNADLSKHIQTSHNPNSFVGGVIDRLPPSQVASWDEIDSCGKVVTTKASSEGQARKHQVSILTRLTGHGYEESSGRHIPCLVVGCHYRFLRKYDLEIHLRSRHGVAGLEFRETLWDGERLYIGQTLQGTPKFAPKHDFDVERFLEMQPDDDVGVGGHKETLGARASIGRDSWLTGHDKGDSDEWLRDELEMRSLIDGGRAMEGYEMANGQEADVIDPALGTGYHTCSRALD